MLLLLLCPVCVRDVAAGGTVKKSKIVDAVVGYGDVFVVAVVEDFFLLLMQ